MRGSADRHYGKRNALILNNNCLIAEYRIVMHDASWRTQRAARYLQNANGLATSFNLFKAFDFRKFSKCFQIIHQRFHKLKPVEFLKSLREQ